MAGLTFGGKVTDVSLSSIYFINQSSVNDFWIQNNYWLNLCIFCPRKTLNKSTPSQAWITIYCWAYMHLCNDVSRLTYEIPLCDSDDSVVSINHRPESMPYAIWNAFAKVLGNGLLDFHEKHKIHTNYQFRFRKLHSICSPLTNVMARLIHSSKAVADIVK